MSPADAKRYAIATALRTALALDRPCPTIVTPSTPSSGVFPSEIGLSWFGVEATARPEPSCTSQAHPEPNCPTPAAFSFSLKSSKDPNAESIALRRSPSGSPPPMRFSSCRSACDFGV